MPLEKPNGDKEMEHKILNSQKSVFWQALLVTLLLFGVGIVVGIILENWRTSQIDQLLQQSNLDMADIKLQTDIYSSTDFNCGSAISENFRFAERIYSEAQLLDRYDSASTLTTDLQTRHYSYDLLRANLLLNSMVIREHCNNSYYEVVYFYRYNNQSLDTKAKQNTFSKLLFELKTREGSRVLLIPLAGDSDLASINILMDKYNIVDDELPVIVINGKKKITQLENIDDLMKNFD